MAAHQASPSLGFSRQDDSLELMPFSLKPVALPTFPVSFPATSNPPLLLVQPGPTVPQVDFYVPPLPYFSTSSLASLWQPGLFPKDLAENVDSLAQKPSMAPHYPQRNNSLPVGPRLSHFFT
ncbi:unnamed protein product [Rangifer tarandus platyrhynchus]|uniref:Uncharacterized protein n=1 Tax=Rangifer tarandus platyrhynchus TaxID=3082113 RepID=A0AC59YZK1_RANTA